MKNFDRRLANIEKAIGEKDLVKVSLLVLPDAGETLVGKIFEYEKKTGKKVDRDGSLFVIGKGLDSTFLEKVPSPDSNVA